MDNPIKDYNKIYRELSPEQRIERILKGKKVYMPEVYMYKYFEDYLTSIGIKKQHITYTDPNNSQIFVSVMPNGVDLVNQHIDNHKKWVINTEQATRPHTLGYLGNIKNIIDYSEENIKIFKKTNPNHTFVHIPYAYNPDEIYDYDKTEGIATIGNKSPRRTKIFKRIKNINHIKGWKKTRDEKLFRHKILVNVHFCKEHNITEQLRINRCIYNKLIVISEKSIHQDQLKLKDKMLFCEYDKIPELANKVLNNYETYYNQLFS